ncbi:PTS fructose transporter subunit IIC [Companilactobacillus alimentarius]|uniref:PTS fructose transporter subunit IIC n=1 Tax=Companilactobacillus alimentarius DSM 20249 TaxID=1423720 RepID=A0A2K9HHK1_9LACO|nr:PTS fructose transporter subunit IIC [Companilactobacillus alimentarius]AUI72009.1 PTS fructose transporter subunit IIC [Companilactobacillus alimentarius DSM 20249]KRK77961.1 PTS family fructose mannitol (fru) porter component IIC [Companilactobacillus alimentarius DSM 20249]MDT6952543.1 PTS fructose transporter subunit IIC [Companilactobacillus alimentarius]GEO44779.1 PTS fructose transporter subunit IIC [Companilactobacillus alimentarius]
MKKLLSDWKGYLMSGISYMIPTVIGGAMIVGIPQLIGMVFGVNDLTKYKSAEGFFHILYQINQVGWIGIGLVNLVIAGYVAYAIGDKPALGAGFIGGQLASNINAGFLGALVAGFVAGYVARYCRRIKVGEAWKSAVPLLIVPLLTTGAVALVEGVILAGPLSWLNTTLVAWVKAMINNHTNGAIVALVLGGMIGTDLGGPINKAAWMVGNILFIEGIYGPALMTNIAICCIPLGYAIATFIYPRKRFSDEMFMAGRNNLIMGSFGITEGAIPFFLISPLKLLPVNMIGGALGAVTGELLGMKSHIPPLGGLPGIITADNKFAYIAGIAAGALFIGLVAPLVVNFNVSSDEEENDVSEDDIKIDIE